MYVRTHARAIRASAGEQIVLHTVFCSALPGIYCLQGGHDRSHPKHAVQLSIATMCIARCSCVVSIFKELIDHCSMAAWIHWTWAMRAIYYLCLLFNIHIFDYLDPPVWSLQEGGVDPLNLGNAGPTLFTSIYYFMFTLFIIYPLVWSLQYGSMGALNLGNAGPRLCAYLCFLLFACCL